MSTLSQLEYIVAVDRLGHFGQAAKACHISQPSLSMQIQKVEREVGFPIFDRLKKPIVPTEKGRRYIEQAKVVLREHQRLEGQSPADGLHGTLRLGVIPTLAPYLVPLFLGEFAQAYPGVELRINELPTQAILRGLQEDTLDAGIAATPLKESGIQEETLFYEPFFLYAHQGNPSLLKGHITAGDLRQNKLWLLADGHCLRTQMTRLCSTRNGSPVFPNVVFEGGTLETLRQLVRHNAGATLVPDLFVRTLPDEERESNVRPFVAPAPSRQISLVCKRGHWKQSLFAALGKSIRAGIPSDLRTLPRTRIRLLGI